MEKIEIAHNIAYLVSVHLVTLLIQLNNKVESCNFFICSAKYKFYLCTNQVWLDKN